MLIEPKGRRDVTLIGTGSELALAVEAAKALAGEGIARRRRVDAVLRAVRGASRELPERCSGFGAARRRRGRARVRLGEMARALTAPLSACTDSALRPRRKTYISISASPPRPLRPRPVIWSARRKGKERMANKRVAINGFGRIGRLTFRAFLEVRAQGSRLRRDQRSRLGRDERPSARVRQRAWALSAARSPSPASISRPTARTWPSSRRPRPRSFPGATSASISSWNAPAVSPTATALPST